MLFMDVCKVLVHLRVLMPVWAFYGEANAVYWKSFERHNSTHLTLLKHQNTKTVLYKLHKNHWVITLFEIFGPVRNKLLVTVSLDHPVVVYRIFDIVFKTAPLTSAKHISLNVHLTNVVDTHAISWSNIR